MSEKKSNVALRTSEFVKNYFAPPRPWRLSRVVEGIGEAFIRLSVKIRAPRCHCPLCRRDMNAMCEQGEELAMELCYAQDQLEELWAERGLTTGEMR